MSEILSSFSDPADRPAQPVAAASEGQNPLRGGAVAAQRSEQERSDGERSGAATAPPRAPSPRAGGAAAGYGFVAADPGVLPPLAGRPAGKGNGRRLVKPSEAPTPTLTPQQRLLLLDTWRRSGLPAGDFAPLVGVSKHSLYAWKKKFEAEGPAGLMDQPRGVPKGSKLSEITKRTILILKESNLEDVPLIVVRKNLSIEKGEAVLFPGYRYFFHLTNDQDSTPTVHAVDRYGISPTSSLCKTMFLNSRSLTIVSLTRSGFARGTVFTSYFGGRTSGCQLIDGSSYARKWRFAVQSRPKTKDTRLNSPSDRDA